MSDPQTPSITDATAASAASQTISLQDVGQRYLNTLQRLFDITAFVVEGTREVTERTYDDFSGAIRFMPSQGTHRRYDEAKAESERWILKNLLADALGLTVPFLEDVRSIAALAHWKAGSTNDNAELQNILTEERQAFLSMRLADKLTHLQNHFSIASPLAPQIQALTKIGACLSARGGVVSDKDVTHGGELTVTLLALQLVPARATGNEAQSESPEAGFSPRVGELQRSFRIGETIRFDKADYLNVITTVSLFVSSMLKALQEEVLKTQKAQSGA